MPAGRPTKYKPEYCEIAEATLAEGFSQAVLAGRLDVDEHTIIEWKKEHPEFSSSVKRGAFKGQEMWEGLGMAGAKGMVYGFNAASWVFNMKNRFGWRDKQEVTGAEGGAVIVKVFGKDVS